MGNDYNNKDIFDVFDRKFFCKRTILVYVLFLIFSVILWFLSEYFGGGMKPRYKTVQGFCEFIFLVSTISVVAYWITEYYKKRTKGAKVSPDKKRQNSLSGWNRAFIAFAGVWTALMIYIAISDVMDGHSLNLLAFKFWLIPIGFVYIAGWTIGWIRRGFKQDN